MVSYFRSKSRPTDRSRRLATAEVFGAICTRDDGFGLSVGLLARKRLNSSVGQNYVFTSGGKSMTHIYRLKHIPTKAEYVAALQSLLKQNKINDLQQAILSAQYWAPNHTAGAAELGNTVGCHFKFVNKQYGSLGHLIANEIGFKPDQREIGTYRWWKVLAEGLYNSENRFIWRMHTKVAKALEELGWVQQKAEHFPQEVTVPDNLIEGAIRQIKVNSYERNPVARKKCIEHYGTVCIVCGFNFEKMYGPLGKGYIHVHHLNPLSEISETYKVNPVNDLRPVCPNCHAMIHLKNPPLTIEQVKDLLIAYGHK